MQTAPPLRLRLLEPCIGVVGGGTRLVLHGVGFRPAPHSLSVRFRVNLRDAEEQDDLQQAVHIDTSDQLSWTSRQSICNTVDVGGRFLLETQLECVLPNFERQAKRAIAARTSLAASSASVNSASQLVPLSVEVMLNGGEQRSNSLTFKLHQPLEVRKVSPQSVLMASPAVVVTATSNILKLPAPVLHRTSSRVGQQPLEALEEMNILPVFVRVRQVSERTGAVSEQTREGRWKLSPVRVFEVEFDATTMGFGAASVELSLNRIEFFKCRSDSPPEGFGYRVHRDVSLRALEPACVSVTSGQVTEVRLMGDGFVDTGDIVVALLQQELSTEDAAIGLKTAVSTKEMQVAQLTGTYFGKNEIRCTVPANMPFGCTKFRVSLNGGRQFGQARVVGLLYRDRALQEIYPASSSLSGGTQVTIRYVCLTLEEVDAFYQLHRLDPPRRLRVRFQPISYTDGGGTQAKQVFAEASPDTPGVLICRTPKFLEIIKTLNGLRTGGSSEGDGDSVPCMWRFTVSVALGGEFFQGAIPFSFYLPPVIRSLTQHHGPSSGDTCVRLRMKHKVPPTLKSLVRFSTLDFAKSITVNAYIPAREKLTKPISSDMNSIKSDTSPVVDEDLEYLISCQTPVWTENSAKDSGEVPHLTIVQVSYDAGVTFFPAIDPPPSRTQINPLAKDHSYLGFLFYPPPVVRAAIPLSADILGGSYIRFQGVNIVDHGAQPSVIFESPTMSRKVSAFVEKGELRCCAPAFNVGLARVFISLNGEQYTLCELYDPETNLPLEFIFYSSPTVTRISPLCACVRQPSELRIFGTHLIETDRIKVRVSFPNSQSSGRRLVFKDIPGGARDGVITVTTPTFPDEYANQNAEVDVALNGTNFSGTSVSLRYFSRYSIVRVDPPLGAFEVPVNLTVHVTPVLVTDNVLVRIRLNVVNTMTTEHETYERKETEVVYGPIEASAWTANSVSFILPLLTTLTESLQALLTAQVELSFDGVHFHGVGNLRDHYRMYNMPQLTSATPLFGVTDRETRVVAHGVHMRAGDIVKLTLFLESPSVENTKPNAKPRRVAAKAVPVHVATVLAEVNVKRQRLSWICPSLVQLRASPDQQFPPLVAARTSNRSLNSRAPSDGINGMLLPERVIMQISVVDGQPTSLPFVFRYYRAPTLVAMNPRVGYVCSGSLVSFEFAERIATPTVDFRFGESLPTTGRIRDERFVECFSPELSAGPHSISISFNEQHFEPVILVEGPLENPQKEYVSSSAAIFHCFPLPVFVLPPAGCDRVYAFGPTSGGTVVAIKGFGFVPDTKIYVRFASQFRDAFDGEAEIIVSAKVVDNETIKCLSPASNRLGRVVLHVSYNLQQFSDSTCFFEYHAPTRYVAKGTLCGPVSGQTPMNLSIQDTKGLPSLTQLLQCTVRFESEKSQGICHVETVDAQFDYETRILSCITPAWPSNELVALRVTLSRGEGELFEDTRIKFLFYDPPEGVIKIEPSAGPITGRTDVLMWCGSIVETGEIVVSIQLTKNEQSRRSSAKRTGSKVDGDTSPKVPKFTQTVLVKGEIVGEAVRFIAPPVEGPCTAVLSISLNGINYTSAQNPLHFTYYVEPILRRINPGWAAVEGANDVLVIEGEHIRDFGCSLLVRFSLQDDKHAEQNGVVIGAHFISNSKASATSDGALQCVFPAAPPGFYELEVSLNGQQFSQSLYVSKTFGNLSGTACTALLPFRHFSSLFCLATATGPAAGGSTVVLFLGGRLLKILSRETKCQVQFTPIRGSSTNPSGSSQIKASTNVSADILCMPGEVDHVNARITCRAPPLRVACVSFVDILLPSGSGASSACQHFGVRQHEREKYYSYESPSITEIAPSCGPTSGGTQLVIEGTNILDTAQIFVRFRSSVNEREFVLVPARYSQKFPGGSTSDSPLIICTTPPVEFVDKTAHTGYDSAIQSTSQLPHQAQPPPRVRDGAAVGKTRTQTYQMLAEQSLKVQRAVSANASSDCELAGLGTLRITRTTAGKNTPRRNSESCTGEGGATILVDFTLNAGEQFITHSVRFHYYQDVEPRQAKWSPRHLPTQCLGGRQAADSRMLTLTLPKSFRLTDSPERVCFRFDGVDCNQLVTKRRRSFVLLHETESRTELVIRDTPGVESQSTMRRPSSYFKNSITGPGSEVPTSDTPPVSRRPALDRSRTGIERSTLVTPENPRPVISESSPCIAAKVISANEVTCSVPDFSNPSSVRVFFSPNAQQFVCLGEMLFHPAMTIKDEFHYSIFRFCSNVGGSPFGLQCSPSTVLKFLAQEDITTAQKKNLQIQNLGLRKSSEALKKAGVRMLKILRNIKSEGTTTIQEEDLEAHTDQELDVALNPNEMDDGDEIEDESEVEAAHDAFETWQKRCFHSIQVILVPTNAKLLKRVVVTTTRVDNQSEVGKMVLDDAGQCSFDMSNWGDQVLLNATLPSSCGYSPYSTVIEPLLDHEDRLSNLLSPLRTCLAVTQLPSPSKTNIVVFGPCSVPFTLFVTDSSGKEVAKDVLSVSEPELHEDIRAYLASLDQSIMADSALEVCYVCVRFGSTSDEAVTTSGQEEFRVQVLASDSNGVLLCLCGPPVDSGLWIVARLSVQTTIDPAISTSSRVKIESIDCLVESDTLMQTLANLSEPTSVSPNCSYTNAVITQSCNVPVTFDFTSADSTRSMTASSRARLVLSSSDNFQTLLALSHSPQIKNGPTVTLECIMPPLSFSGSATLVVSCGGVVFSNAVKVHCYDPRSWRVLALSPPCGQLPMVQDSNEPQEPLILRLRGENFVENRKIIVRVSDKERFFTAPGKVEQVHVLSLRIAAVKSLRSLLHPLGIGLHSANAGAIGSTTSSQKREDKYLSSIIGGTTGGGSIVALASSWSTFTFTLRIECGDQRVFASCREVSVLAAITSGSVLSWEEEFELRIAADRRSPLLITAELSEPSLPKPLELAQAWLSLNKLHEGSAEVRRFSTRLEEHFKRGNYVGSDASPASNGTASEIDLLCQLSPLILHPEFITAQIPYPLLQQLSPQTLDVQVSSGDGFYSTPNCFSVYKPPIVIQSTPSVLPRSSGGDVFVTGSGFVNSGRVCVRIFAFKKNRFKSKDEEHQALASINRVKRLQRTDSTNDGFLSYFTRDVEGAFVSATSVKFRMPAYLTSYNVFYSVSFDGRSFTEASRASNILMFSISAVTPKGGPISGNTYTTLHGTNIDACLSSRPGLTSLIRVTWKRGARDLEHVMVPGEFYAHEDAVYFYSPQSKFGLNSIAVNVELSLIKQPSSGVNTIDSVPRFGRDEVSFVMYKTPTIKSVAPLTALVSGLSTTEVIVQGFEEKAVSSMKLAPKLRFKRRGQMQVSDAQLVSDSRFECVVPRFNVTNAVAMELPVSILSALSPNPKLRGGGNGASAFIPRRSIGSPKLWTRASGIFVALLGARNLRASKKNACNPFAVVYVGKAHLKSTRKDGAFNPVWNELFDFEWVSGSSDSATLPTARVVLESQLTADQSESLGHVEITFPVKDKVVEPFALRAWFPLRRIRGRYAREENEEVVPQLSQQAKSKKPASVSVSVPLGEIELAIAFIPPIAQTKKQKKALRSSIMSAISTNPQSAKHPQGPNRREAVQVKREKLLRAFRQRGAPASLVPTELAVELALNGQDFWSIAPSSCYSILTPIILDVEPKFICIAGGSLLYVSGNNFVNSGCLRVAFAVLSDDDNYQLLRSDRTVIVDAKYRSNSSVVCTTPPLIDLAKQSSYIHVYVSLNGADFDSIALPKKFTKLSESVALPAQSAPSTARIHDRIEQSDEAVTDEHLQKGPRKNTEDDSAITLIGEQYVVDCKKVIVSRSSTSDKPGNCSPSRLTSSTRSGNYLLVPQIRVFLTPKITRVRPTDGIYTSHLTIDGTNFTNTNTAIARFTSQAVDSEVRTAKLVVVSSTRMECSVPDFPRGVIVRVAVAMNGVEFVHCPGELRVFQSPHLTELYPSWVSSSTALELELRGINLTAAMNSTSTDGKSNIRETSDNGNVQVSFSGLRGRKVVRGVCENGIVRCSIPKDVLQVPTLGGRDKGTPHPAPLTRSPILVDIWLGGKHNAFTGSPLPLHVYREIPTVHLVSPMDGPVYGGFAIVVQGRGFIDTGKIVVRFQLYVDPQESTPRSEDDGSVSKPPQTPLSSARAPNSSEKRQSIAVKDLAGNEKAVVEPPSATTEPAVTFVDVVAKFISPERVLCPAPSFPQEGVYTVLVALNSVEFSRVSDGSWFLAWQNWQKRKRLLSHALFSRASAPDETATAAAIAGAAAASTSLEEDDIDRLRRKSSFMLPKIRSAMTTDQGESSSASFKSKTFASVSEENSFVDASEDVLSKDPRLLQWHPTSITETRVSGRPLLSLLEYLCGSRDTQQFICRRLTVAFRLQSAQPPSGQEQHEAAMTPVLRFPSFVDALRLIFPNALMRDLEELWHAADHRPDGSMTLKQLLRRLLRNADQRSLSPEPGPTHYEPRYKFVSSRETAAIIFPPIVQPEHKSDPPSALFIDYDAAVQVIKPRPPRQVFRKRKFNTSWCNPVVEGAPQPAPPSPRPPSEVARTRQSLRTQINESAGGVLPSGNSTSTSDGVTDTSDVAITEGTLDNSRNGENPPEPQTGSDERQSLVGPPTRPDQGQSSKEDAVRTPGTLSQATVASNSKRLTSPQNPKTTLKPPAPSQSPPTTSLNPSPSTVMARQAALSGPNPFYNDIGPLYAKFLNSTEVKRFLKQ